MRNKLLSYLLIVAILLGGVWAQGEIKKISENENLLKAVESEIHKIDEDLQKLRSGTDPVNKAYARVLLLQLRKEQERDAYESDNFYLTKFGFLTSEGRHLKQLDTEVDLSKISTQAAGLLVSEKTRALLKAREAQVELKAEYEELLKWARKWKELLPTFWLAAGILSSAIAAGIAIKVFLYFVIAPAASRRPPIQILPEANGTVRCGGTHGQKGDVQKVSSVSVPILLTNNIELLVRPEYLQRTSSRAKKSTRWLLNCSVPYASLLSGMFLLTRVKSSGDDEVVVSATKDPLSEVCVLDLPENAAFVCQPRALVGVIQDPSCPIRISRHWRLGTLQSWLTLQLRFLVFHGPGQLIVKGCRGVKIEGAGTGRIINQAATLGFSANIYYANTRCETFMSYWMGKDDLFNDIFTGELGSYVYEEMPDYKQKNGIAGRGLEGVFDAVLNVFGI